MNTAKSDDGRVNLRSVVLTSLLLLGCFVSVPGCASLVTKGQQDVWLVVTDSARVFDSHGNPFPTSKTSDSIPLIKLTPPQDDVVAVQYKGSTYAIRPTTSIRGLAVADGFGSWGIFSLIDDVNNNDYEYNSVSFKASDTGSYLRVDPNDFTDLKKLFPRDHHRGRFYGILELDASLMYPFDQAPLLPPAESAGLGLGYSELLELYFRYESINLMHLTNNVDDFTGYSLTKALKLRIYPYHGLYIGGSYGWLNASTDSFYHSTDSHTLISTVGAVAKSTFHTFAFSIGYAGKWAFAEIEQSFGIPYYVMFGSQPIHYTFWIIRFGVNARVF
jgi:hypothetical protein